MNEVDSQSTQTHTLTHTPTDTLERKEDMENPYKCCPDICMHTKKPKKRNSNAQRWDISYMNALYSKTTFQTKDANIKLHVLRYFSVIKHKLRKI